MLKSFVFVFFFCLQLAYKIDIYAIGGGYYFNKKNTDERITLYESFGTSSDAVRFTLFCGKIDYISGMVDLSKHKLVSLTEITFADENNFSKKLINEYVQGLDYYTVNEKGTVPYIEAGDLKMTEGIAILTYIAEKYGVFMPTGISKYKVFEIINFVATDIYRYITIFFNNCINCKIKKCLYDSKLEKNLTFLNKILGDNDFFVDNKESIADFYILSVLTIVKITPTIELSAFPNLERFYNKMNQRSCIQNAIKQGIDENKRIFGANE